MEEDHRNTVTLMVFLTMFALNLVILPVSIIIFLVVLNSNFYMALIIPFLVIEILALIAVIATSSQKYVVEGYDPRDYFASTALIISRPLSVFRKPYLFYVGWLQISFILMIIVWVRPLALYLDINGIWPGYAGKSTCISTDPQTVTQADRGTYIYNPFGAFTFTNQFESDRAYEGCVLYTQWANTNGEINTGFAVNSLGTLQCDQPQENGRLFNSFFSVGVTCQYSNWKNPAFGIDVSSNRNTTNNLFAPANDNCPSTLGAAVDVDGVIKNGQGKYVKPVCLKYLRDQYGVSNSIWPPGYDDYPYDSTEPAPGWCAFCPAMCYSEPCPDRIMLAPPNFWLAGERIGKSEFGVALGWVSTVVWLQMAKWIVLVVVHRTVLKQFKKINSLENKPKTY